MKTNISCANCHYPIGISKLGETIECPLCQTINESIEVQVSPDIGIPEVIGLLSGGVLGGFIGYKKPKIMTSIYGSITGATLGFIITKVIRGF